MPVRAVDDPKQKSRRRRAYDARHLLIVPPKSVMTDQLVVMNSEERSMTYLEKLTHKLVRSGPSNRWGRLACAGIAIALGCFSSSSASAQALDGNAIHELALKGTWAAENDWGYWSWSEDKTVCFRKIGANGDCADTGTWAIDGDVMCYELTWFGESYDVRKNCVTVHALDDGRYETRYHGLAMVSTFITFKVLD
jgi:hypothetical protein